MQKKDFNYLLVTLARSMRILTKNRLKSSLTFEQIRAISYISRFEGTSQINLAALLESKPISVSKIINVLESLSLVIRKVDSKDRRSHQLYLSNKGIIVANQIKKISKSIFDVAVNGLSDMEIDTFYQLMLKIQKNITEKNHDKLEFSILFED